MPNPTEPFKPITPIPPESLHKEMDKPKKDLPESSPAQSPDHFLDPNHISQKAQKITPRHSGEESHKPLQDGLTPEIFTENFLKNVSSFLTKAEDSSDSPFEKAFRGFLKTGKSLPPAPQNGKASFASKTNWPTIFTNMANLGSVEKAFVIENKDILETLFRGTFEEGGNAYLVSDLKLDAGAFFQKFCRIILQDKQIQKQLQSLNPGDPLPAEITQKLGEKLAFTKMVHDTPQPSAKEMEAQGNQALNRLRQNSNPVIAGLFEQKLIGERDKKTEEETKKPIANKTPTQSPFWFLSRPDDNAKTKRNAGKPRFFVFFVYAITIVILFLILQYVVGKLF